MKKYKINEEKHIFLIQNFLESKHKKKDKKHISCNQKTISIIATHVHFIVNNIKIIVNQQTLKEHFSDKRKWITII